MSLIINRLDKRMAMDVADFITVVPGIRPAGAAVGDQKRIMTPALAAKAGASYIVVGRPIIAAPDPVAAAEAVLAELAQA